MDILEKGPYEKEKYTKVDLPFPHGSEDISLLTCEIFCRLKEAFMQLNDHAPKNSKVIVLYSYRYYFGVPLPDHFNPLKLSTDTFLQDKNNASVSLVIFLSIIDDFNKTFPNPNRNRDFNISSIENAFK